MSMISVKNLGKQFGENIILKDISVDIEKGEVVSIIGPSGTGKSTFLRALNFLDPPTNGEVFFEGEKLTKKNIDSARHRMGMVFQNFGLFSHLNVMENLIAGPMKLLKKSRKEAEEKALQLLKTVGLSERATFFPRQLSGGQKQRVAIARCLAMDPDVILFDEPTSALDPTMVSEVMMTISSLAKSGMTMLVVTHEMDFARNVSNRVFYMDEGIIYEQGKPEEIFENPQKPKTQSFIYNIRSFNYQITSKDFDFVEMLGGIENFCLRNSIEKKMTSKLQLLAEELTVNIVTPKFESCSLNLSFSKKLSSYELSILYRGENFDALENAEDELSAMMVRKSAKEVRHEYNNGENIIKIIL